MGQLRLEKIQEFIKQEVSKLILTELKDPRVGFVTVTRVEATGDLRQAKVYISLLGTEGQKEDTWQALKQAIGFLRTEVGKRLKIRHSPELTLHRDESLDHSVHIQKLLDKIKHDEVQ